MRFPKAYYQMRDEMSERFPMLRPSQQAWLALWVFGSLRAKSSTQPAVVRALSRWGSEETLRQRLREGLYDGKDRAAPCSTEIDVRACFPFLFAWVISLWKGDRLPLALDATFLDDEIASLSISVLFRGSAIPVAWKIVPANAEGEWKSHLLEMLSLLAPVVPEGMAVFVMTDRGLWCPEFYRALVRSGWHPLMRIVDAFTFRPNGEERRTAKEWVGGPGRAFAARGIAFGKPWRQLETTLIGGWTEGEGEPWILLTDLPPDPAVLSEYGLRYWIENGFRQIKSLGWKWQRTRRRDPKRVERHWLAMAIAQLRVLAAGAREEDRAGRENPRTTSLFERGIEYYQWRLPSGSFRRRWALIPDPSPRPFWFLPNRIVLIT
jgi:hypothetical protein